MNVFPVFPASVSSTPGPLLLQDDHAELGGSFKRSVIRRSPTIRRRVTPSAFALRATADRSADLPDGLFGSSAVQPPFQKNSPSRSTQIKSTTLVVPPHRGRIAIVTDAGRDAVDAAALGVRRDGRAGS